MHWIAILDTVSAALTLTLTIMLVHEQRQLLRVAGIAAFAASVAAFLGIFVLVRQGYKLRPTFSIAESKNFLHQSLPLCATWASGLLYTQANYLILGAVRGEADVGLYGAAVRMSQVFYQPIWLYFAAMAPALMQTWQRSPERARSLLTDSVRLSATSTIGAGIVAASAGTWLLAKIFGKPYSGSGQAFEIMIWTGVIMAMGQNWSQLCIAAKRNRILLGSNLLGAIVNIAFCIATVHRMGIEGAALSNLLASITVAGVLIWSFGWQMGFKTLQSAAKPALAGAGAYAVSLATRWSAPPVCALLSILSFLAILFMIGGISSHDLKRLRALLPWRLIASELQF
jgi:PST family polysaccharide transporter